MKKSGLLTTVAKIYVEEVKGTTSASTGFCFSYRDLHSSAPNLRTSIDPYSSASDLQLPRTDFFPPFFNSKTSANLYSSLADLHSVNLRASDPQVFSHTLIPTSSARDIIKNTDFRMSIQQDNNGDDNAIIYCASYLEALQKLLAWLKNNITKLSLDVEDDEAAFTTFNIPVFKILQKENLETLDFTSEQIKTFEQQIAAFIDGLIQNESLSLTILDAAFAKILPTDAETPNSTNNVLESSIFSSYGNRTVVNDLTEIFPSDDSKVSGDYSPFLAPNI